MPYVPKDASVELISRSLVQSGAGRVEGDQVAVSVEWLGRRTASRPEQWHGNLQRMLDYASAREWIDPAGEAVIAHIERV